MRALRLVALFASVGWVLFLLVASWAVLSAGQQHFFGFCNGCGNGSHYLFFSGWGSIVLPWIGNAVIAGVVLWWHSQCVVTGCYWPSRRRTAANEKVCWRHAPHRHRTFEEVCASHHLYLGQHPGKG